jgi:two-component system sensor histidine kinase DesK
MEPMDDQRRQQQREPWDQFGWLMGVVWVFFLHFPISGAIDSDADPVAKAVAVGALLLFGAAYIAGFIWITTVPDYGTIWRRALPLIVVLSALMTVALLLVGVTAFGAMPFVIAVAMFAGPLRRSLALGLGLLAIEVVVLLATGSLPGAWVLPMPAVIVILMTWLVRWVIEKQNAHEDLARWLDIVAERERVARDVHDTLGHSLTVVTVKAELAGRLIDLDPAAAKAEIEQIRSLSREALGEVRATVAGLRVARLADEIASARIALEGAGIAHDIPDDAEVVDPRHRLVAAWTLREAVTNVVRHSRAAQCRVEFAPDRISVEDDGVGVPPQVADGGLRSMRERAEAGGATLTVEPGPDGRGTRVEVRW